VLVAEEVSLDQFRNNRSYGKLQIPLPPEDIRMDGHLLSLDCMLHWQWPMFTNRNAQAQILEAYTPRQLARACSGILITFFILSLLYLPRRINC
jgi:hypothetical protein